MFLERKGSFNYGPQIGTYDGEWSLGQPHGHGRFTSPNGTVFDGDWSSTIAAGYGSITGPGKNVAATTRIAGWETFLPFESPREAHNDVLDSIESPSGLTKEDVKMLISHCTERKYTRGDVILHEGEVNDCLYRIKSGTVRLTKEVSGHAQMRDEMTVDQMFGEMSVLDKNVTSATVVAASDLVELYTIELDVLYELFKTCPGFSMRFHHAMATTLAERLMRFFEPRGGRALRQTFSGMLGGVHGDHRLANQWVDVWNTRGHVIGFCLDTIEYRDPWVPQGVFGKHELSQHWNNLKESGRFWTWEESSVSPTPEGFRVHTKMQVASSRSGAVTRLDAVVEVLMNRKENKIRTLHIGFDKDALMGVETVADTRLGADGIASLQLPYKPQDIKFCHRFNLPDGESMLWSQPCLLVPIHAHSSNIAGTLFVSQRYLCFYSKVFDHKSKEVVPLKAIKSVKPRSQISGILVKYNAKTARKYTRAHTTASTTSTGDSYLSGYDKNIELQFSFPVSFESSFNEVSALIAKGKDKDGASSSSRDARDEIQMDGYRVATETLFQKFARCSKLELTGLSYGEGDQHIRRSMNDHGLRIAGPNATETSESYGSDLCGRTVSTYPKLTRTGQDGVVRPLPNDPRQGDPICDQFCIERMENKVIFAVADGCNWGAQPRRAALLASRTFCDFVKHNLSQMTTINETSNMFLHAFEAAHTRIVEGFEPSKIWECGTTTLLGGAIMELAPTAQYVERRWGIVLASVGDCKAFLISSRYKTVIDLSQGSRSGHAAIDASDCGGRLGPHVGEGNPDLRNLSFFYHAADEGDVLVCVSDGVYDNLDPQSLGISPVELGLEGDSWDSQLDLKKVDEVKQVYVCQMIRDIVFGPQRDVSSTALISDDSYAAPIVVSTPRPPSLNAADIVEKLVQHCLETTQSSRDFMEQNPEKILPKNYREYPGKLDHTTCVALKVKRSTFKPVENQLDSLVLRMRNQAQGLQTYHKGYGASDFIYSKGETIDSPRGGPRHHADGSNAASEKSSNFSEASSATATFLAAAQPSSGSSPTRTSALQSSSDHHHADSTQNHTSLTGSTPSTTSLSNLSNPLSARDSNPQNASSGQSDGANLSSSSSGKNSGAPTRKAGSNTILNLAMQGEAIIKWLKDREAVAEIEAEKLAQMLLGFRYIRPLDVDWKNETFNRHTLYNFQVYEPILTQDDWEMLLRSATRVVHPKDTVIVKEGVESNQRLYYIIYGKCRTVKLVADPKEKRRKVTDKKILQLGQNTTSSSANSTPSSTPTKESTGTSQDDVSATGTTGEVPTIEITPAQTPGHAVRHAKMKKTKNRHSNEADSRRDLEVSTMTENETFGEISFLFSRKSPFKASASVVADTDVELYIIEGSWVNILFVKYPGMAGRFYHYLASVLAHRLKKQEILESQRTPSTP